MADDPTLFATVARCPATREAVVSVGNVCPLCADGPERHEPEAADVIRDDGGDLGAWMMSLPRTP